jgi:MFS family permease
MNSERRNVALLTACQAMLLTNNSTLIAINGLAGLALAANRSLATLPVTFWVLGGAVATMRASLHMKRVGRRRGLTLGTLWGFAGALVCAGAIWLQNFWLLCFGALVYGVYNAYGQYYRFAAADAASVQFRPTAISLVLAGGLVGGVLGPTTSRVTVDLLPQRFLGAYLALILFLLVTVALLRFIRIPDPSAAEQHATGRPLSVIARQPKYLVAVAGAAIGYGVMNFLMTSTPLAMRICGHPYGAAAFVISSHVVGMYLPSFFTGGLIRRFGSLRVMFAGAALNAACVGVALTGVEIAQFWFALVLLGMGWNFLFIGATTLLTETYRPEERAKAQGANDSAIFVMMALSSFSSGLIVTNLGWNSVNYAALPLVAVIMAAIAWLALLNRRQRAAAA